MSRKAERPVGLTKDTGWQIGVRRTLPIAPEAAWQLLTSPEGVTVWLGPVAADFELARGAAYQLPDGTSGTVRVFKPGSHLRLTWHPPRWPRPSTIQVRVTPSRGRSVIAFHQEHMPDARARVARRTHYTAVLDQLEDRIRTNE